MRQKKPMREVLFMRRMVVAALLAALLLSLVPAARADSTSATASTSLYAASSSQKHNIALAVGSLSYFTMEYGDHFSFNDMVGPRDAASGYLPALNGRGVSVVGGGVAQVASTMYLALLQIDDIAYDSLYFYGERYTGTYVTDGYYAVLTDYNQGLDFAFTSYFDGTLSIFLWEDGLDVTCLILMDSGESGNLVGYASTPLYGTEGKRNNIALAAGSIFGATLNQYQAFSFNGLVGPRKAENGYVSAVNGRGVNVVGGGVAQVASTVYLAVKSLPNVVVTDKKVYNNFTESYVTDINDAILTDYTNHIDFAFYYTGYGSLVLYTYLSDTECICEVYEY